MKTLYKKKLALMIAGLTTTFVMAGSAVFAKSPKAATQSISMLYLQQAAEGNIAKDGRTDGCYTLTMNKVDGHVMYVSEEPARYTGELTMSQFFDSWRHHEQTKKSYPNAILHAKEMGSQGKRVVNDAGTLYNMRYNSKTNTLSYKICPVKENAIFKEGQIEDISLFIDPFDPWPP